MQNEEEQELTSSKVKLEEAISKQAMSQTIPEETHAGVPELCHDVDTPVSEPHSEHDTSTLHSVDRKKYACPPTVWVARLHSARNPTAYLPHPRQHDVSSFSLAAMSTTHSTDHSWSLALTYGASP